VLTAQRVGLTQRVAQAQAGHAVGLENVRATMTDGSSFASAAIVFTVGSCA
jgi:hypothetical protein